MQSKKCDYIFEINKCLLDSALRSFSINVIHSHEIVPFPSLDTHFVLLLVNWLTLWANMKRKQETHCKCEWISFMQMAIGHSFYDQISIDYTWTLQGYYPNIESFKADKYVFLVNYHSTSSTIQTLADEQIFFYCFKWTWWTRPQMMIFAITHTYIHPKLCDSHKQTKVIAVFKVNFTRNSGNNSFELVGVWWT